MYKTLGSRTITIEDPLILHQESNKRGSRLLPLYAQDAQRLLYPRFYLSKILMGQQEVCWRLKGGLSSQRPVKLESARLDRATMNRILRWFANVYSVPSLICRRIPSDKDNNHRKCLRYFFVFVLAHQLLGY